MPKFQRISRSCLANKVYDGGQLEETRFGGPFIPFVLPLDGQPAPVCADNRSVKSGRFGGFCGRLRATAPRNPMSQSDVD